MADTMDTAYESILEFDDFYIDIAVAYRTKTA